MFTHMFIGEPGYVPFSSRSRFNLCKIYSTLYEFPDVFLCHALASTSKYTSITTYAYTCFDLLERGHLPCTLASFEQSDSKTCTPAARFGNSLNHKTHISCFCSMLLLYPYLYLIPSRGASPHDIVLVVDAGPSICTRSNVL